MVTGRGGPGRGQGRKSNAEIQLARELMDKAISSEDWMRIWANLAALAMNRQAGRAAVEAARLLASYRFGMPTQVIAGDPEAAPLAWMVIEREGRLEPFVLPGPVETMEEDAAGDRGVQG